MDETNSIQDLGVELVTKSDLLGLKTWERQRSSDELIGFISRREMSLSGQDE